MIIQNNFQYKIKFQKQIILKSHILENLPSNFKTLEEKSLKTTKLHRYKVKKIFQPRRKMLTFI